MRPRHPRPRVSPGRAAAGFTLIELLVVLGIIGLLISITLVVGGQVMNSGKVRLTQDTIRVLDTSLEAYLKANETNPEPWVYASDLTGSAAGANVRFPAADARDMEHTTAGGVAVDGNQMINSVGVYMFQASKFAGSKAVLEMIPSKMVTRFDGDGTATAAQPMLTTAMDAWGHPIRYVHPAFQGTISGDATSSSPSPAQGRSTDQVLGSLAGATPPQTYAIGMLRRNHVQTTPTPGVAGDWADSDGGTCVGGRPYFYSAGPDGLVGLIQTQPGAPAVDCNKDNVYTVKPQLLSK
jgi:prepilin-type N-terminal cleavage/methylation domain-containing protein